MMTKLFLVTPKREIPQFTFQADRDYFSKPVEVVLSHSVIATRQLYVTDNGRGHTYPVDRSFLKRGYQLTNKERALCKS